jgi:hypothetical protein
MRRFIVLSLLCLPAAARSQQAERSNTVAPGMTRAQVVAALGGPATQRTAGEFTYMFYPNSCGRSCGMNDLVILKHDSVSDAIFRSPNRHYTGTSSSPQQATPEVATRRAHPAAKPMTTPKSDGAAAKAKPAATPAAAKSAAPSPMKPPAKANDTKPSIPVKAPTLQPAPAKSTAPSPTKSTTSARPPAPDKKTG